MAQPDGSASEPPPPPPLPGKHGFLRKLFGRPSSAVPADPSELPVSSDDDFEDPTRPGMLRRMSRKVVPGLPRAQTFKRQLSESRAHLAPVEPTPDERRAVSVDRRSHAPSVRDVPTKPYTNPRTSAPGFLGSLHDAPTQYVPSLPVSPAEDVVLDDRLGSALHDIDRLTDDGYPMHDTASMADTRSLTTSQYDNLLHDELETVWILNLSMHFRDRSKREKFFVTYRERDHLWRRVTVSLDYRNAPVNSLEMELIHTKFQKDKNAKIYDAIRESLADIQFYDTVTNLKLQTTDGRLHVHVVEDGNEIIPYPSLGQFKHLNCPRIREKEITFGSHMSGFVYKVSVHGQVFIKKEIPGPDTIEEFIYEVNALSRLHYSDNVIKFYGIVVDDDDEFVKGLLISYADQGPLVDIVYDHCKDSNVGLSWATKERWARQIVHGLSDIHESGFVQGDFTLSNIVIDDIGDAKIIDINRRGCPMGWEPPEATGLLDSGHRISMYIGVKSDLFQLGMVLWALAMDEDEPDLQGRPLILGPEVNVPDWYRQITEICLSDEPRMRLQASSLLQMFPSTLNGHDIPRPVQSSISVDDGYSLQEYLVDGYHEDGHRLIRTVQPPNSWSNGGRTGADADPSAYEPYYYTRGRSPPSPLPSNVDQCESPPGRYSRSAWAANRNIPPSYSDVGADEVAPDEVSQLPTPTLVADRGVLGSSDEVGVTAADELQQVAAAGADGVSGEDTPTGGVVRDEPPSAVPEADTPKTVIEAAQEPKSAEPEVEKLGSPIVPTDIGQPLDIGDAATEVRLPTEDEVDPEEAQPQVAEETAELANDVSMDMIGAGENERQQVVGEEMKAKADESIVTTERGPAEKESTTEPEHNASSIPGNTVPHTRAEQIASLPANPIKGPDLGQPTDQSSIPPQPAAPAATESATTTESDPAPSHSTEGSPRETKLRDSLAGVGTHVTIDDKLMDDTSILNDDFGMEKRAEPLPTLMITTDSPTHDG